MNACACAQTLVMSKQNKSSSVSGKIDGTVFRNSPNLKNAFSLDDDLICLLLIVSSVKQIITVACGVRRPESVQTLLQKWKRKNAQLALELYIYCCPERKMILISIRARIFTFLFIHL